MAGKEEDYMSSMPVYGLDHPYGMPRCNAQHPTLRLFCQGQAGHAHQHTAATEGYTETITWEDQA